MVRQDIADMVAAARDDRALGAVVPGRPQPHADMRGARERDHAAHHRQGAGQAAVPLEARREVQDLQRMAELASEDRLHDRRVGQVALFGLGEAVELDLVEADGLDRLKEIAEHRVAVEAGHAGPDQPRPRVQKSRIGAVSDHGEIKRLHPWPLRCAARCQPRHRSARHGQYSIAPVRPGSPRFAPVRPGSQ